jgi:hypothetical protein
VKFRITCPLCDWTHEEYDVESIMPRGLMAAFSDPDRLSAILSEQLQARLKAAGEAHILAAHFETKPN